MNVKQRCCGVNRARGGIGRSNTVHSRCWSTLHDSIWDSYTSLQIWSSNVSDNVHGLLQLITCTDCIVELFLFSDSNKRMFHEDKHKCTWYELCMHVYVVQTILMATFQLPVDFPSPFVPVMTGQTKSFHILSNMIPPCLSWASPPTDSI